MDIIVSADRILRWDHHKVPCVLGKGGIIKDKREGDGGTPVGQFLLRSVFFRPDHEAKPQTSLPCTAITPAMGWCDAPEHPDYNRLVTLPHPASCETLWRDDDIYDLLIVLGHNDDPVIPHHGSAIFMHLVRPDLTPTQGCIALHRKDLLALLRDVQPGDYVVVRS